MPSAVPTTPAKITAVKPTTIETRAPKISRDSTSRPSWSVPSRCSVLPPACQNGGWKRAVRLPTSGLCGARTLAKIAVKRDDAEDDDRDQRKIAEPDRGRSVAAAATEGDGFCRCAHVRHFSRRMRGSITA